MRRWVAIIGAVALTTAACAGAGDGNGDPSGTEPPSGTSTPPAAISWSGPEVVEEGSTVPLTATAVAGPGGFVAHREVRGTVEGGPTTTLYFSADGESWDQVLDSEGLEVNGLVAGGPGYVAVGTRYLPPDRTELKLAPWAAWSVDGQTWQEGQVALPAGATSGSANAARSLGPAGALVVVPATVDAISVEGTWFSDVVATDDGFVALGGSQRSGQSHILWASEDGEAWSPQQDDPFGDEVTVRDLVAGTQAYVAYGNRETEGDFPGELMAWQSADAVTWEPAAADASFVSESGEGPLIGGVVPLGDGFVMVGIEWGGPPLAWTSSDGSEWGSPARLPSLTDVSAQINAVGASPDRVVAVGREVVPGEGLEPGSQHPGLWTSTDGVEWAQVPPEDLRGDRADDGITIDSVAWADDHWIALGGVWDYPDEIVTAVAWTGR